MSTLGPAMATVLSQVAKVVKGLNDAEIDRLVTGETRVVLLPKGAKVELPIDFAELADTIRRLRLEDDIIDLLAADKRLNVTTLKKLADELNVTLPTGMRAKLAIQLHIGQTMAAHNQRTYG